LRPPRGAWLFVQTPQKVSKNKACPAGGMMNLVILLLDACWLRVNNQRCEPDTKTKGPGSLRSHGLNGNGAALYLSGTALPPRLS